MRLDMIKGPTRDVVAALINRGWTAQRTRRGHVRLTAPNGRTIFTGTTNSDYRAARNLAAHARRAERDHTGR